MKAKHWIKDLTVSQVIHAPTEEIADKLCNKFHELGFEWGNGGGYYSWTRWEIYQQETCYLPKEGQYSQKDFYLENDYEILTIDDLLDFQEEEDCWIDPNGRRMLVWNSTKEYAQEFTVYAKLPKDANNRYASISKEGISLFWKNAEPIPEPEIIELTIEQIADKFGVSVGRLKIKK